MEKGEIVNFFLEKGLTLNPEGLDYFHKNPEQIDIFFERAKQLEGKPTTVDIEMIKNLLETAPVEIEEIKKSAPIRKAISVDDISRILTERYEKIQRYFSNRIDLVNPISINKITQKAKRFSLVVMVREKNEREQTLEVEDLTGETIIHVDSKMFELIVCDEVLGIVCEKKDDRIEAVSILWPDIPLKREITKIEGDVLCMFLSDLHLEEDFEGKTKKILREIESLGSKQAYIFLFGENASSKKTLENFVREMPSNINVIIIHNSERFEIENTLCFSSPAFLRIRKKINLLMCDKKHLSFYKELWKGRRSEEIMLNLLKMRHLDPIFKPEKALEEDRFIIDTVPDIFISGNFDSAGIMNYKGTTIISCGSFPSEPLYWIVNLRTRESIKINLT